MHPDDDDTRVRSVISTTPITDKLSTLRRRQWIPRLKTRFKHWRESVLLLMHEHRPVPDYLADRPMTMWRSDPQDCHYCPFGQEMLPTEDGVLCPRCHARYQNYEPCHTRPYVAVVNEPVTPLPSVYISKRPTGNLMKAVSRGAMAYGDYGPTGFRELRWDDVSKADTQLLPRISSAELEAYHRERTEDE